VVPGRGGETNAWNAQADRLLVPGVKKPGKKPTGKRKRPKIARKKADGSYETVADAKPAPFFDRDNITIYNADILTTDAIPDNSVDLIVTSPPYNVDIAYNSHDDKLAYSDYLEFTQKWIAKCFKLAKPDGRFCLNIPLDKNKGGQRSVYADITTI
jgi:hypothetical protein